MLRYITVCFASVLVLGVAVGQEAQPADEPARDLVVAQAEDADTQQQEEETPAVAATTDAASGAPKTLAGMSILGNEEAPKSLVIVPWKSSEIGDGLGVTDAIDERARPVDKEVFLREVHYYELRSGAGG